MKSTFHHEKARRRPKFLWFLGALVAGVVLLALVRTGPPPEITIEPGLPGLGPRTPVTVRAAEPRRGLSDLRVELVQGDLRELLAEKRFEPRPFWAFWGAATDDAELVVEAGHETIPELEAGEAVLRVTAGRAPTWLRSPPPATRELTLPVRKTPPTLGVVSRPNNVAQGGSAVVTYEVGEASVRDGVEVGERFFPGYPLPGDEAGRRFALFAVPHDHDDRSAIRLIAADELGNRARVPFVDRFQTQPLRTDTIRLSDDFLARVVPAILAETPDFEGRGDLLSSYLAINGDLRRRNTAALEELSARSQPRFRWRGRFLQQPNTQVMASYAERRSYLYDGREVDQQDHLGFDLASVRQAPVPAANAGVVLLAEYFGIYGKTVVLDHGYGLLSLYAHLSSIDVEVGQEVARGEVLGKSGETGLAGGDHLHYSMLVHGVQVDPREWWDGGWIRSRIAAKLGPAVDLTG